MPTRRQTVVITGSNVFLTRPHSNFCHSFSDLVSILEHVLKAVEQCKETFRYYYRSKRDHLLRSDQWIASFPGVYSSSHQMLWVFVNKKQCFILRVFIFMINLFDILEGLTKIGQINREREVFDIWQIGTALPFFSYVSVCV